MKRIFLLLLLLPSLFKAQAQVDPVLLKINEQTFYRSEFESALREASSSLLPGAEEEVNRFMKQFILNRLKIEDAIKQQLDTIADIRLKLMAYRQELLQTYLLDHLDDKPYRTFLQEYEQKDRQEQRLVAQLFRKIPQDAAIGQIQEIHHWIDSAYRVLSDDSTSDFLAFVKEYSDTPAPFWVAKLQTSEEFEKTVFGLAEGELSKPFYTPQGIHVVKVVQQRNRFSFEEINQMAVKRWLRKKRTDQNFKNSLALNIDELWKKPAINRLLQKYEHQLLLAEITKREVEDRLQDRTGLQQFFNTHKKHYSWEIPHYRGVVIHCKERPLIRKAKRLVKGLPVGEWAEIMNAYFNAGDSLVVVEQSPKGTFAIGENPYIDKLVFKQGDFTFLPDYPCVAVIGKKTKTPESYREVSDSLIIDYKNYLETLWESRLQADSKVEINEEVLKTVNNH